MKKIAPITLLLFLVVACTNQKAQIEQLEAEVIKIHDDVMPKSIEINRTQRALKVFLKDSTTTKENQGVIRDQIKLLDEADKAMSDWMVNYKAPLAEDSFEQTMTKLNEEKQKITKVKDMMLGSLESGEKLLKTLKESSPSAIE